MSVTKTKIFVPAQYFHDLGAAACAAEKTKGLRRPRRAARDDPAPAAHAHDHGAPEARLPRHERESVLREPSLRGAGEHDVERERAVLVLDLDLVAVDDLHGEVGLREVLDEVLGRAEHEHVRELDGGAGGRRGLQDDLCASDEVSA